MANSSDWLEEQGHDDFLRQKEEDRLRTQLEAEADIVIDALGDGILGELARYLRAEGGVLPELPGDYVAIPRSLADELVSMIEGDHPLYRLQARGRVKGEQGLTKRREIDDRRFRIGYCTERRIREIGHAKRAKGEAAEHFRVGKTKIDDDLQFVRRYLEDMKASRRDGWKELSDRYSSNYPWPVD